MLIYLFSFLSLIQIIIRIIYTIHESNKRKRELVVAFFCVFLECKLTLEEEEKKSHRSYKTTSTHKKKKKKKKKREIEQNERIV